VKILLRFDAPGDIQLSKRLGIQRRAGCRKLEMQGGELGKHAPANANKLITMRAAIITSLP